MLRLTYSVCVCVCVCVFYYIGTIIHYRERRGKQAAVWGEWRLLYIFPPTVHNVCVYEGTRWIIVQDKYSHSLTHLFIHSLHFKYYQPYLACIIKWNWNTHTHTHTHTHKFILFFPLLIFFFFFFFFFFF